MESSKVSVPTPPKHTTSKYGYAFNIYSYITRDKFVCDHYGRLGQTRPNCFDILYP